MSIIGIVIVTGSIGIALYLWNPHIVAFSLAIFAFVAISLCYGIVIGTPWLLIVVQAAVATIGISAGYFLTALALDYMPTARVQNERRK